MCLLFYGPYSWLRADAPKKVITLYVPAARTSIVEQDYVYCVQQGLTSNSTRACHKWDKNLHNRILYKICVFCFHLNRLILNMLGQVNVFHIWVNGLIPNVLGQNASHIRWTCLIVNVVGQIWCPCFRISMLCIRLNNLILGKCVSPAFITPISYWTIWGNHNYLMCV